MQLRDTDTGSTSTRPPAAASGATDAWFEPKNPGGGIVGTTLLHDFFNDFLGNIRALMVATGITQTRGPAGDGDLLASIDARIALLSASEVVPGYIRGLTHSLTDLLEVTSVGGVCRNFADTETKVIASRGCYRSCSNGLGSCA